MRLQDSVIGASSAATPGSGASPIALAAAAEMKRSGWVVGGPRLAEFEARAVGVDEGGIIVTDAELAAPPVAPGDVTVRLRPVQCRTHSIRELSRNTSA